MTTSEIPEPPRPRRARRGGHAVALWLSGLSTTVLLVGIWGRAVATDQGAIEAGTRAVLESEVITERITGWIEDGIEANTDELPLGAAADAASAVWDHPDTRAVLAEAVDRLVEAALGPPGTSVPVDLGDLLRPLAPVVVGELGSRGISLSAAAVDSVLAEGPTIVLGTEAGAGVTSAIARARSLLTKVSAVGLAGMMLSGIAAVVLAEERLRQVRRLAVRVAVSALTFSVLLRFGSWALDPGGGRSPLAAGGSVLLGSSGHVLVIAAFIAAGIAFFATVSVKHRRRQATA